jgi:hypothetical protein
MAENKKSVLLYCDIIHTVEELDDIDAGLLFKHYLRYINDQNPEPPSKLIKIVFEPIKQNLKRDLKKWEQKSLKNSENAHIRWNKENANAYERIKSNANHADKDTVKVKDKVNESYNTRTQFILGTHHDTKYFLIVPKTINSPIYRINGEDGMKELFEQNQSIIKNKSAISTFLLNNSGAHFNEFSHVYNKFNLHIENAQAYGR